MKNTLFLIPALSLLLLVNSALAAESTKRKKLPLVVVVPVSQGLTAEWLERRVVLKPRQLVKVLNEEPGRVLELLKFEGDRVRAGEILALQDDGLVRAEWLKLKARKEQVLEEWKRLQVLRQEGMVSAEAYGQVRTQLKVAIAEERLLAKRLAYMSISSPLTGVVSERLVEEGDVAERYRHLFSIMDNKLLKARVAVEAEQLIRLHKGSKVWIRSDFHNARQYKARVTRIFPALDEMTHQGTVEIELLPGFRDLRPGQLVSVRLEMRASAYPVIPLNALRQDQQGSYVFRLQADGRVERRSVSSGRFMDDKVEIRKGLNPGERVVVRGFSGLKHSQQVKVVTADAQP